MPIVTPSDKEIVVAKPTLHALAQGMAQLAAEASGITVSCRQCVS
jgi:hypothetical protein